MYIHQSFRVWCEESDIMAKQELYQFDPGGRAYLMVMLEIDSSAILVEPMKSKKDAEMQRAYLVLV